MLSSSVFTFNRTNLEWKLSRHGRASISAFSFNRTNLEWKHNVFEPRLFRGHPFNRTNLEWKRLPFVCCFGQSKLLIAPIWNGN